MDKDFTTLIVEDDPISFELYKTRLENYNLNIIHAENGKIAVEKTVKNPDIDLILMDIRMPVMDGYEATKEIRKFNKKIPVLLKQHMHRFPNTRKCCH